MFDGRRLLKVVSLWVLSLVLCHCQAGSTSRIPSPYAIDFRTKLTPKAQVSLRTSGDSLVVAAYYFGDPKPAFTSQADAVHRLQLQEERFALSGNTRRFHLSGNLDPAKLAEIVGEPKVLINLYSALPVGASDDLIYCHSWIGTVRQARMSPPVIACEFEDSNSGRLEIDADN